MREDEEDRSKRVPTFFPPNLLYVSLGYDIQLNERAQAERESGKYRSRAGGLRDGGMSQGVAVRWGEGSYPRASASLLLGP